jgi:hypothetical protein
MLSMKTKDKIIQLVEMGLSPNTIAKLDESQIDILFKKISLTEQGAVMISADKASRDPQKLKDLTSRGINIRIEGEVDEDNVDVMGSAMGGATTQAPHQVMAPDGMGDDSDAQIDKYEDMTEAEEENNPWAICHTQLGPKKTAKFERCVKAVKKSLKEGTSPMDFFIEEKIVSLVENYLEPKMTKEEFLETIAEQGVIRRSVYKPKSKKGKSIRMSKPIGDLGMLQSMSEAGTETAPVKPTTKPDTKPNVRPGHPGKKPFEGPNPAPKASQKELDKAKNDVLKLIQGILRDGKK